jgi:hypothetical protein
MNNRKVIKYRINILSALVLTSCIIVFSSCESITRLPQDQITNGQFWNTPTDIKNYNNQFYNDFRRHFEKWYATAYWEDGHSDNMANTTGFGEFNPTRIAGRFTINSENDQWDKWYGLIRSANFGIENADNKGVVTNNKEGKRYMGELRFFRGYFYYQLLRLYGGVPWIGKTLTTKSKKELQAPRTPRNQVVDSILVDLNYAIANLPPRSQTGTLRLNKETAMQFKARVALYEGTWEKYHKGDPFWVKGKDGTEFLKEAANAAKKLIDMRTLSLSSSYRGLFTSSDLSNNPGVMFALKYNGDLGLPAIPNWRGAGSNTDGGSGLTLDLVQSYLMKDGKPYAVSPLYKDDNAIKDLSANRDPRLDYTMYVPGDTIHKNADGTFVIYHKPALTGGGVFPSSTGFVLQKGDRYKEVYAGRWKQNPELPLFRYAETLLDYAEAKASLGIITQHDLDITVNKLRDRVGMPHLILGQIAHDPNWKFPNLSPALNEVRREKRIEFACAGFRLDDLMRWGAGSLLIGFKPIGMKFHQGMYPDLKPGVDVLLNENGFLEPYKLKFPNGYQFNRGRDYLIAIPPQEIVLNSNLTQNPGWSK